MPVPCPESAHLVCYTSLELKLCFFVVPCADLKCRETVLTAFVSVPFVQVRLASSTSCQ